MLSYGIFSPIGGIKEDIPSIQLSEAYTPESCNVELFEGLARKVGGRRNIFDTCPEPIQYYHNFIDTDGSSHLFAFCGGGIYKFNYISNIWDNWLEPANISPAGTIWSVVTFQDQIYATNQHNIFVGDPANKFDLAGAGSGFEYATEKYITACEFIAVFENRLILAGVTEHGAIQRRRLRFSGFNGYDFLPADDNDSGYIDVDCSGTLVGYGIYQDYLVIYTGSRHYKMWWVGGEDIFNIARVNNGVGLVNCNAICSGVDGQLYYFSPDGNIREFLSGRVSRGISKTLRSISRLHYDKIRAFLHPHNNQIWFSIPANDSDTNNMTVCYDPENGSWHIRKYGVSCFGLAHENTELSDYTWDDLPFDSWDDWNWDSWDSIESDPATFLSVIGADGARSYVIDGSIKDNTEKLDGHLILATNLGGNLGKYKRIGNITTYFKPDIASAVDIAVSCDDGPFRPVGSLVLGGSGEYDIESIPVDLRGRQFRIKVSGSDYWRFVGMLFDFTLDGDR